MNLMILLGMMFLMSLQPIIMVSVLIIITFIYSFEILNFLGSYWLSYVLLMVMMSGVLVVFMYMVILIPNESFEMKGFLSFFFVMMMMLSLFCDIYFIEDMSLLTVNLWVTFLGSMSLFLAGFLLVIMLMVVVLSYISDGAIRV